MLQAFIAVAVTVKLAVAVAARAGMDVPQQRIAARPIKVAGLPIRIENFRLQNLHGISWGLCHFDDRYWTDTRLQDI
jgi:hypothetical protein